MTKPTPEQALLAITKIAFEYKGSRREHEEIELCLQSLRDAIKLQVTPEPSQQVSSINEQ